MSNIVLILLVKLKEQFEQARKQAKALRMAWPNKLSAGYSAAGAPDSYSPACSVGG